MITVMNSIINHTKKSSTIIRTRRTKLSKMTRAMGKSTAVEHAQVMN